MIRVRFHLARGPNYMKWQISYGNTKIYLEPKDVSLYMYNCILINRESSAKAIYNGGDKTVCAWIACDYLFIDKITAINTNLQYNPRINPYWTYKGKKADGENFNLIVSANNKLEVRDV